MKCQHRLGVGHPIDKVRGRTACHHVIMITLALLAAEGRAWDTTEVGTGLPGETLSCTDLVLDSGDVPHICFAGEMLRYATFTADGWHAEVIDSTLAITGAALDLMADDSPVAAWSAVTEPLACAWRDSSSWRVEVVEDVRGSSFVCIGLDGFGCVHLCYHDPAANSLRYALRTDGGWEIDTVDDAGSVGWYCDLDLDEDGRPHISYADYGNGNLKYARMSAEGWQVEVVDDGREVGWETSLKVDESGEPHVVYYDSASRNLRYARHRAYGWEILPLPSGGLCASLALDSGTRPHAAFVSGFYGTLRYGYIEDAWNTWVFQGVSNGAWDCTLALDMEGNPHLAYLWAGSQGRTVCYTVGQAGLGGDTSFPHDYELTAITIAPNPCVGYSIIRFRATAGPLELKVFDLSGREVERLVPSTPLEQTLTWRPSCPPGAYVLALLSKGLIHDACTVTVMR